MVVTSTCWSQCSILTSYFDPTMAPDDPPPKGVPRRSAGRQSGMIGALPGAELHPALINGTAGVVITVHGRPYAVMGFTVAQGKIVEIDAIADPARVEAIAASVLNDEGRSI